MSQSDFTPTFACEVTPQVLLWMLRMLVPMGCHNKFLKGVYGFSNDRLAHVVGLGRWVNASEAEIQPSAVKRQLIQTHNELEAQARAQPERFEADSCLQANIEHLNRLVGLNRTEQCVLSLAVQLHTCSLLDDLADLLGPLSSSKTIASIAEMLALPIEAVRNALGAQGILSRSGLVMLDRHHVCPLKNKLDLLSSAFADTMTAFETDPLELLKETVQLSSIPDLTLADYPHMSKTLDVLCPFLKEAIQAGRKGVNIFIHGKPGTGKTQLVKCLAAELELPLFEVASEDEDGDPVNGVSRLRAYRAAQSFFSNRPTLILFDEVEDVFREEPAGEGRSPAQSRKAWINRTLEDNPVPAFWLSNNVDCLDPAFVRRFDLIFELPIPPRSQRQRMLDAHCATLVSAHKRAHIADNAQLAPALVSKAVSVIKTIENRLQPTQVEAAFELILGNTLKAQGHQALSPTSKCVSQQIYDPDCTHADADLAEIAHNLKANPNGRLCLYGPPGTGKTAYGHWLARQLDKPLLLKKASDLVSKYLGETEQNLAQAFLEAEYEGAVLMIDEVDSFLQSRESATRSWEVSQVNEFLTQLEAFEGVFIATTNLMGKLDAAAMRRFDLKIKFDYMRPEQSATLLENHCHLLCETQGPTMLPTPQDTQRVRQLHNITPGDFAAVLRQSRLCPMRSASALVKALEAECALKPGSRPSAMGFLAA